MEARGDTFKYSGDVAASDPAWRVVIVIGRSRRVEAWVVAVALAALVATLATSLPAWAKAIIAILLAVLAIRAARRHGWREGPGVIRRLVTDLAGSVEIERADGSRVRGRVLDGSFVAPWLVIVRWRPEEARFSRTILLAPDAVDEHEFRRLRVLLRWR